MAAVTALALIGCHSSEHHHDDHSGHSHGTAAKAYPLKKCIVKDEDFHGETVVFVHEGQEIKLCCKDCRPDFDKEPAKYLKKLSQTQ
ncbi:MAG: hypothetical protein FJ403_12075 [Verrucomicrobia bacterium]|nr:hypothetical protein [Verrucomicrobiota bacterium]